MTHPPATGPQQEPCINPALCPRCGRKLGTRMTRHIRLEGSRVKIQGKIKVTCPWCKTERIVIEPLQLDSEPPDGG